MTDRELIGTGPWLKYIWKAHIGNWLWRNRLKRRIARNLAFGELKMTYLRKYSDFARGLHCPENLQSEELGGSEERVFTLWYQGEMTAPEIVKKCFKRLREAFGERLVFLTEHNLYDYISLPDYIMKKWKDGNIGAANFSDLVRIELLYQYGGYWFDATDFITGEMPKLIEEQPFFMYVSSDVFFPHMFVQTCFMRAEKKDPLLTMWRELVFHYWKNEEKSIVYFLVHMLLRVLVESNQEARRLFERMPKLPMDPTHLLWNKIGNLPFNKELYEEMLKEAFFQKCSYRPQKHGVKEILPGSMADYVINGKA